MNVILFLLVISAILGLVYYFYVWSQFKHAFSERLFYILAFLTIGFSLVFNGLIDRIFVIFFSIFLVFAKFGLWLVDT